MNAFNLVNLTPHTITIFTDECGHDIPSEGVARVKTESRVVGDINGIPVVETTYGEIEGLPEPKDGTIYIVSGLVRAALNGTRDDVVSPDTGPTAVRNDKGQIVGVTRLTR